jgi:hypothetical protein
MGVFDGFAGAAVGALGGLLGASSANKESAASVDKQIEFQREQSNTSYQRAVADMNAAGLSPMLAYSQGGASTSPGASYKAENVGAAAVEGAAKGSQPSLMKAQTAQATELAKQASTQAQLNIQSAKQVAEQARKTAYEVDTMMPTQLLYDMAVKGSQITSNNAGAIASTASARNTNATANLTEEGKAPSSDSTVIRTIKDLAKYGISMPNQFFNDMIGNVYSFGKSKLKGKK